jgi:hypothetical protein
VWGFTPEPEKLISDYLFKVYYSLTPHCDFKICRDENGDPMSVDGGTVPLELIHPLKHYDFNKWYYYRIKAIRKPY